MLNFEFQIFVVVFYRQMQLKSIQNSSKSMSYQGHISNQILLISTSWQGKNFKSKATFEKAEVQYRQSDTP